MIAIEKGFQIVADAIKKNTIIIPDSLLAEHPRDEIITGSIEIIAAEVSANTTLRHSLIAELQKIGDIVSTKKSDKMLEKLNQKDTEQIPKFALYSEFNARISRIKPYQILALNRGENLGILTIKLDKDEEISDSIHEVYANHLSLRQSFIAELESAFRLGYDALFGSVENEIR
jgi:uncharacterized protein